MKLTKLRVAAAVNGNSQLIPSVVHAFDVFYGSQVFEGYKIV